MTYATPQGWQPAHPLGSPAQQTARYQLLKSSVTAPPKGEAPGPAPGEGKAPNLGLRQDQYSAPAEVGGGQEAASKIRAEPWSDEETLRLLEALEMYKDDWGKVRGAATTTATATARRMARTGE